MVDKSKKIDGLDGWISELASELVRVENGRSGYSILVIRLRQLLPLSAPLKTYKYSLRGSRKNGWKMMERKKKGKKKEENKQKVMTLRKQYYSNFPAVINLIVFSYNRNHSCLTSYFFHI